MSTDVIYAHAPIRDTPTHTHAYSARVHPHTRIPFRSERGARRQGALRCAPTEDHWQSEGSELKKGGIGYYCIEISEIPSA